MITNEEVTKLRSQRKPDSCNKKQQPLKESLMLQHEEERADFMVKIKPDKNILLQNKL